MFLLPWMAAKPQKTKALLLSYQRAVDASVADANIRTDRHHRIRSDYNAWRVARSELYKAIENLDWQPLQDEI